MLYLSRRNITFANKNGYTRVEGGSTRLDESDDSRLATQYRDNNNKKKKRKKNNSKHRGARGVNIEKKRRVRKQV